MLDPQFELTENKTTVRTELVAGLTTFLTLAYIIIVNPATLAALGFFVMVALDHRKRPMNLRLSRVPLQGAGRRTL